MNVKSIGAIFLTTGLMVSGQINFDTYRPTDEELKTGDLINVLSPSITYEANTNFNACNCDRQANTCDAFCCCDKDCKYVSEISNLPRTILQQLNWY